MKGYERMTLPEIIKVEFTTGLVFGTWPSELGVMPSI